MLQGREHSLPLGDQPGLPPPAGRLGGFRKHPSINSSQSGKSLTVVAGGQQVLRHPGQHPGGQGAADAGKGYSSDRGRGRAGAGEII